MEPEVSGRGGERVWCEVRVLVPSASRSTRLNFDHGKNQMHTDAHG